MKFLSQASLFLSSLVLFSRAFLIPPSIESDEEHSVLKSVAGSTDFENSRIFFPLTIPSVTEHGCERVTIQLDVHSTVETCTGRFFSINGHRLDSTVDSQQLSGPIHIDTIQVDREHGDKQRIITADWTHQCLDNDVTLLKVVLHEQVNGLHALPSGFSVSFRQQGQPTILVVDTQVPDLGDDNADVKKWAHPCPRQKLEIVANGQPEKLSELNIEDTASEIVETWRDEVAHCSTVKCYLKTAINDASAFAKLILNQIRHRGHNDEMNTSDLDGQAPIAVEVEGIQDVGTDDWELVQAPSTPELPEQPTAPGTPSEPVQPTQPTAFRPPWGSGPPPWVKDGASPPWGDGPPPWIKNGEGSPWGNGPPPWVKNGQPPPWARPGFHAPPWAHSGDASVSSHSGRPTFTFAHDIEATVQAWRYHVIAAVSSFVVVTTIAALLFVCIKRRKFLFADPRRRADCAARWEERRRRKAYRKAACKHRFHTFMARFRRSTTVELGENEGVVSNKTQDEGSAFSSEIGNLRAAHDFVDELVKAEEGYGTTTRVAELDGGDHASITETLPAYSLPPGYAVDVDGDISVIDGFTGYTPSGTDRTPESSVVDCSPRMSFETQRTTLTRATGE